VQNDPTDFAFALLAASSWSSTFRNDLTVTADALCDLR
jgi:hypothetical protein